MDLIEFILPDWTILSEESRSGQHQPCLKLSGKVHLLPNSSSLSPLRELFQLRRLSIAPDFCLEGDMILASLSDRTSQLSEALLTFDNRLAVSSRFGAGWGSVGLDVSLDMGRISPGPGVLAGAGRYKGRPGVKLAATEYSQQPYDNQT